MRDSFETYDPPQKTPCVSCGFDTGGPQRCHDCQAGELRKLPGHCRLCGWALKDRTAQGVACDRCEREQAEADRDGELEDLQRAGVDLRTVRPRRQVMR